MSKHRVASSIGIRRKNVPCRKMPAPDEHVIVRSAEIVAALSAEAQIILANLAFNLRRLVFQKTPEVAG